MDNIELATLIRGVIKEELEPINKRLDLLDNRMGTLEVKHDITNKRIEELSLKVEGLELNLKMTNHNNKKEFARIYALLLSNVKRQTGSFQL